MDQPAELETYRTGLDLLVADILKRPADSFSMIRQIRCRPLLYNPGDNGTIRCYRCGRPSFIHKVLDIERQICCQACSGLEPAWFKYINGNQT